MLAHRGPASSGSPPCRRAMDVPAILATLLFLVAAYAPAAPAAALHPGDFVMISERGGRLVVLDGASFAVTDIASGGALVYATDVAVTGDGRVLLTTSSAGVVEVDPSNGTTSVVAPLATLGEGVPSGLTVGPSGSLFVSMQSAISPRVIELTAAGEFVRVVTSGGLLPMPAGLAFGAGGVLYVCTTIPYGQGSGGGIASVDPASGAQAAVAGAGVLIGPYHIAVAPDGALWTVQYGSFSARRGGCVVRTQLPGGDSATMPYGSCTSRGIAIRADGVTVVADCMRIHGDCWDAVTYFYPSGLSTFGVSGPVAVVPDLVTPSRRDSWGRLKLLYR